MTKDLSGVSAVVIGGGTGSPVSIKALLDLGADTSCVVAMADDGGSTGILREEADVTPPGDIRKCIAAMAADPEDPLTRVFQYRFKVARNHTLGNLMLAALEDAAKSFPEAIEICERMLNARGHVYPSTLDHVTLSATTRDGIVLDGQAVACHSKTALEKVKLASSNEIRAYSPAIEAIRKADLIVLGPGSLFTSIIPNLLVEGIVDAIRDSHAVVLFVCSLADVQGETWGLTVAEHVRALLDHGMDGRLDMVLVHRDKLQDAVEDEIGERIAPEYETVRRPRAFAEDLKAIEDMGPMVLVRDLSSDTNATRHSKEKLADALLGVMGLCRSRAR